MASQILETAFLFFYRRSYCDLTSPYVCSNIQTSIEKCHSLGNSTNEHLTKFSVLDSVYFTPWQQRARLFTAIRANLLCYAKAVYNEEKYCELLLQCTNVV